MSSSYADFPGSDTMYRSFSYHVTKVATDGLAGIADDLQYGHRCHRRHCMQPMHGVQLTPAENLACNVCKTTGSHVKNPEGSFRVLCPHPNRCVQLTQE